MTDYSVRVDNLGRNEIMFELGIAREEYSTKVLQKTLAKKRKKDHPIHKRLQMLSNQDLFDLRQNLIQTKFKKDRRRILTVMANYFFENFMEAPLTNLNRILEEDSYFAKLTSGEVDAEQTGFNYI